MKIDKTLIKIEAFVMALIFVIAVVGQLADGTGLGEAVFYSATAIVVGCSLTALIIWFANRTFERE